MTRTRRLVAICILNVSLFGVAFADGGATQGPPVAPPAPQECTADCSSTEESTTGQTAPDSTVDIVTMAEMLAAWLVQTVL